MKFKTPELEQEFSMVTRNLHYRVLALEAIAQALFQVELTITSVFRKDASSPHFFYRAVDIRSSDFFPFNATYILDLINLIFPYAKAYASTLLLHDTGHGWHFYLQVRP